MKKYIVIILCITLLFLSGCIGTSTPDLHTDEKTTDGKLFDVESFNNDLILYFEDWNYEDALVFDEYDTYDYLKCKELIGQNVTVRGALHYLTGDGNVLSRSWTEFYSINLVER